MADVADESVTHTPADERKAIKALAVQLFPKIVARYQPTANPHGIASSPEDTFDFYEHKTAGNTSRQTRLFLTYNNDAYVIAATDYVEDTNEGIDQLLVLLLWAKGDLRYGGRWKDDVNEYGLKEAKEEDVPLTGDVGWIGGDVL